MEAKKRRFRVSADFPGDFRHFNTPSISPKKPGEEFETDDWRFLAPFDGGQAEWVEEVAVEQETPAPASKKEKGG